MGDESSSKEEPPPKEPAKKDANVEKAPAKPVLKSAPAKARVRSPTPQLDSSFTDSDDPDGDVKKKKSSSKTPEPPKEASLPSKSAVIPKKVPTKRRPRSKSPEILFTDSDDPDGAKAASKKEQSSKTIKKEEQSAPSTVKEEEKPSTSKTVPMNKPYGAGGSFKPLATSTPRPSKAQPPVAPGAKSYGVAGAASTGQSTVKGVRKTQVGQREFYDKYPWLKPTQPSALAASSTTSEAPSTSAAAVDSATSPPKPPAAQPPSSLTKPKPAGSQPLRAALPPKHPSSSFVSSNGASTGARPNFRSLAQPFNVMRLGAAARKPDGATAATPGDAQTTPASDKQPSVKKEEQSGSIQRNKNWKKPWSEMTVNERLEQRKMDMLEIQDRQKQEDERKRAAYPRPPATTVTPTFKTRVSDETIKKFHANAALNSSAWKEGGRPKQNTSGLDGSSASDMLHVAQRPFKRDPPSSTPQQQSFPLPQRFNNRDDPFAPPSRKTFDPLAAKKKKIKYNEKKAAVLSKSPEKGKSPLKKGAEAGGEDRPADENNDSPMDFNDDFGGGGMSDHGGDGGGGGGAADISSSIVDVGSPTKAFTAKKEGGAEEGTTSVKVKKEQDQEARRKELLTPSMKNLYTEEMAALARDKAMFERELMEKMSRDKEKLPALPTLSQLQTNLRVNKDDLREATDRLVVNMKRIGDMNSKDTTPQGELTKHLNNMLDTMKDDVFLGTVRTEVYEAQENMFAEATHKYVKGSDMMKLTTDDYARAMIAAKAARQEKEQSRLKAEKKREERRRAALLQPKGRITKKALSMLTEAQRRKRSLPPPKTPPGSPPPERNSPPVSTAGSRYNSPERLPQPVTPPGSPPPPGEKSKKAASRKHLEVVLDESFDGPLESFDSLEGEERKLLKLSETKKKKDLETLQRRYDFALNRYKEVEMNKEKAKKYADSLSPDKLPPVPGRENKLAVFMDAQKMLQSGQKMRELLRLSDKHDFASNLEMSDGLPMPRRLTAGRGGVVRNKPFSAWTIDDLRRWDGATDDEMMDMTDFATPMEEMMDMEDEEAAELSRRSKSAIEQQRAELAARGKMLQPPRQRLSVKEKLPVEPLTEEQLQQHIQASTTLFEDLFTAVCREDLTEKEKEHHINKAVNRAEDLLTSMENALRAEISYSIVDPSPIPLGGDGDSSVFVADAGADDEDIVLKSKRSKRREPPALQPEGESREAQGEQPDGAPEAPPTLNANPKAKGQVKAPTPLTQAEKKTITLRLASLWKMSEDLPAHIKTLARRAMPTTDAYKAKTVLDLRSRIVSAERLKGTYRGTRRSVAAKQRKIEELEEYRNKHSDQIFDRMLEKMIDDCTETPNEPAQADGTPTAGGDSTERTMEPTPADESDTYLIRTDRLRREDELRRAEATRQAKKREEEVRRAEEERKKMRARQCTLLGGVVVQLQAGQTLSRSSAKAPDASPTDPEAPKKRRVLIRKEISVKELESRILSEFYEYWQAKKSRWNEERVGKETIEKHTIEEMNEDLEKGTFPIVEKSAKNEAEEGGKSKEKERERAGDEEQQPGTSEDALSADAVKEKEKVGAALRSEEMKQPNEMEPAVRAVYNRWRLARKQAREVRLNTGTVVDEIELEEVEVPEGATEEETADTRPFQIKRTLQVLQGKKDDVGDRSRPAWMNTVPSPGGDLASQLGEKQRILKKQARGEKLTNAERRFLATRPYDKTDELLGLTPARRGEGARKMVHTRRPGGGSCLRLVPVHPTRPRTPTASVEADVLATLKDMLKQICGDDGADAAEEEEPPFFDVPSDGEAQATVTPAARRGTVSSRSILIKKNRVTGEYPTIVRSVPAAGGKRKTLIWSPAEKRWLGDTAAASTTPAKSRQKTTPPVVQTPVGSAARVPAQLKTILVYKSNDSGSASTAAPPKKKKDPVREVMDDMLKEICGDDGGVGAVEVPKAKKRTPFVFRPAKLSTSAAGALEVSLSSSKKEIFFKPVAKKTAKLVIPAATPLHTRRAPVGGARSSFAPAVRKPRDPVADVVEDMVRIVCAQQADPRAVSATVAKRILEPSTSRAKAGVSVVRPVASDPDDDIIEVEDDDEERGARSSEATGAGRQKVMKKKRKQMLESQLYSEDEDEDDVIPLEIERGGKKARVQPIILRNSDPIRMPERRKEEAPKSPMPALSLEGSVKKTVRVAPKPSVADVMAEIDLSTEADMAKFGGENKLGWIDCLRLVDEASAGESTRMRRMRRKISKMERKWQAVDEATARKMDEQKKGTEEKMQAGTGIKGATAVIRKTVFLKGAKAAEMAKKRYFTTKAGKKILLKPNLLKPRRPIDEGKRAPQPTLKSCLANAIRGGATGAAASTAAANRKPPPQTGEFRFRPVGMPKLARPAEKERRIVQPVDEAPELNIFDDENATVKPSKRVLEKREARKRRAGSDDEDYVPGGPTPKKKYRILQKLEALTPGRAATAAAAATSGVPTPRILQRVRSPTKVVQLPPPPSAAQLEATKREQEEILQRAEQKKQQEWEIRKNEATINRQTDQIEMQKRLLAEIRKEMVKTFEDADKTNKLVERTRRAMIGECKDFVEFRKLVDAREKLMNTLYEQTMEKMKATVATEETRRRHFDNYKKKAIRREKTLIKEVEHTKDQLDKAQQKLLETGFSKKAPLCPVPFTKAPLRSKNNRSNFVLEAIRRVLGDGVEGDEELEKEQVKAIIEKITKKYDIQTTMSVEQDREFCQNHEIGYRKRIHMKKFLAKLGLDFFCSQRSFDKVRRELGEADGTEETSEMTVKREKRERKGVKKEGGGGGGKKRMIDPREISLGRSGAEDDEASDVDIEELILDDDYNIIDSRAQMGVTDGGETSGAERERAERRYNMARFAGTRLLTSDEEYVEESDPDQPGPSHRYIPLPPTRYAPNVGRPVLLPAHSSSQSTHYLHGPPILQPLRPMQPVQQQRRPMQPMQQLQMDARRGRGGARVRGGHNGQ